MTNSLAGLKRPVLAGLAGAAIVVTSLVGLTGTAEAAGSTVTGVAYAGGVVPIPDSPGAAPTGGTPAVADLPVAGLTGTVADVDLSIDGSACTATAGATTVGIDHSWVGDLKITLIAPDNTEVLVINRLGTTSPNTIGNGGNNFCQTVLDDESGGASIQSNINSGAPFTGSWKPNAPLSAFDGLDPNGTWHLQVQDFSAFDTGNIRAFSLTLTTGFATVTSPVTASPEPADYGDSTTLSAVVTETSSGVNPTGTVAFLDGATTVCQDTLVDFDNGFASCDGITDFSVGTHSLHAAYEGDADNLASVGPNANHVVGTASPFFGLVSDPFSSAERGEPVTFTATVFGVGNGNTSPTGTVAFTDDGGPINDSCNAAPLVADGNGDATATCKVTDWPTGAHHVVASYAGDGNYGPGANERDFAVHRITTSVALTDSGAAPGAPVTFTATVDPVPDSGTVQFSVDGTDLGAPVPVGADGSATSPSTTLTAGEHQAGAVYSGSTASDFYGGSSATKQLQVGSPVVDPTITAKLSSAKPRNPLGWYRTPVTVTFACQPGSAPLTAPCPPAVTLRHSGVDKSLTRTIHASDGGSASVTVSHINIDRIRPKVHVEGAANGGTYPHKRQLTCVGHDSVSGLASCRVHQHRDGDTVRYRAKAIDNAGNTRKTHGHYFIG